MSFHWVNFLHKRLHSPILICLLVFFAFLQKSYGQNDTLIHISGDTLVGTVKGIAGDKIKFDSRRFDVLTLDHDEVQSLTTGRTYMFTMEDGMTYIGRISPLDSTHHLIVRPAGKDVPVRLDQLVDITSYKNSFGDQFSGKIGIGGSYTSASKILRFNGDLLMQYETFKRTVELQGNSIITFQEEADRGLNQGIYLNYQRRFLGTLWFWAGKIGVEQNTELGIRSRIQATAGIGRYLLFRHSFRWKGTNGLSAIREYADDGSQTDSNLEYFISTDLNIYDFGESGLDLTASETFYVGITNKGRLRNRLDLKLDFELFNDFSLNISFYHNFDQRPPSEDAVRDDYGVVGGIRYSF